MSVDGTDVFTIERLPSEQTAPTVLFLHGAAFKAETWVQVGILDDVASRGSRAIAVDLPGFGRTPSIQTDRGEFLGRLIDESITDLATLAVWGSDDNGVDLALADRLLEALPAGNLVVIDNGGHAAYNDDPEAFVQALTEFLETIDAPTS